MSNALKINCHIKGKKCTEDAGADKIVLFFKSIKLSSDIYIYVR